MISLHTEKKPAARATIPNKTDGNFGSNESFKMNLKKNYVTRANYIIRKKNNFKIAAFTNRKISGVRVPETLAEVEPIPTAELRTTCLGKHLELWHVSFPAL
jgi:hypothetical protein